MEQFTFWLEKNEPCEKLIQEIHSHLKEDPEKYLLLIYEKISDKDKMQKDLRLIQETFPTLTCAAITNYGPFTKDIVIPEGVQASLLHFEESTFHVFLYDIDAMTAEEAGFALSYDLDTIPFPRGIYCSCAGADNLPDNFTEHISSKWNDIPVFGIQAADWYRGPEQKPLIFLNGEAHHNVVLAIVFAGEKLHVKADFTLGWKKVGREMIITASDGKSLVSGIDGENPQALYRRYLHLDHNPDFYDLCAFPLLVGDEISQTTRVSVDQTEDAFFFSSDMPVGEHVSFSYARENDLLKESLQMANEMQAFGPQAMFCITCQDRRIFLGNTLSEKELSYFRTVTPSVLIGNGYGEILRDQGRGGLHSSTTVVAAMREGDTHETRPAITDPDLARPLVNNPKHNDMIVNFLEETTRDMQEIASLDFMTRLYNRRAMLNWIHSLDKEPVSAMLFDVDQFKRVNDMYGHDTGDLVLSRIAELLIEKNDLFKAGRWGGDEFIIIARGIDKEEMGRIAEEIRTAITTDPLLKQYDITISGGAAGAMPAFRFSDLYKYTDRAMYHSKHFGGNRITIYTDRFKTEMEQGSKLYSFSLEMRSFLEQSETPIFIYQILDDQYHILLVSKGYCRMVGEKDVKKVMAYLRSRSMSQIHPDDADRVRTGIMEMAERGTSSIMYRQRVNDVYHNILSVARKRRTPEGPEIIVANLFDIDFIDAINQEMYENFLAAQNDSFYKDEVTGLPSINYFNTYGTARILDIQEQKKTPVVIFMDIAGMHAYNDRFGYNEGNKLLHTVGEVLRNNDPGDLVVRYAEDHFVLISTTTGIPADVHLKRINDALASRLQKGTASLKAGVYYIRNNEETAVTALDKARQALNYIGNDRSKDVYIYDEAVSRHYAEREYVLYHFHEAVEKKWITVYFQPLVRTLTGRLCGSEALARWKDPEKGILPPSVFIKPLEDFHLIHLLDLEIIRQVCEKMYNLEQKGIRMQSVSVNLSRADFTACDIFAEIEKIRKKYELTPDYLHIEITESTMSSSPALLKQTIEKFQAAGYTVWMDDFGSDYANLNILEEYHFDWLKIDMNFLSTFNTDPSSRVIIASVVELAKKLGIHTLCEGVETREEFEFLRSIGCEVAQGYYFAKPMPLDDMIEYVIKCGHEGYEPLEENAYYDSFGLINFLDDPTEVSQNVGNRPLALVERKKDDSLDYVFCSESYQKQEKRLRKEMSEEDLDLDRVLTTYILAMMDEAEKENKISFRHQPVRGYRLDVRIRFLAEDENRKMYALTIVYAGKEQ